MGGVCVSVCMCVSFHMGGLTCGGCMLWMDDKLCETNTEFNYCSEACSCGWKFPAKNERESIKRHCEHEGRGTALS